MPRKNDSWGIEIGANAIKAMRLVRSGSRIELAEYDILPFKQILTTPDLNVEEAIQVNLDTFLSKHEVAKSTVVVSVPGHAAFARFVKLPPVEPKKIPAIVRFEAVQQIPFPIDQVEWDYQTFQNDESPDVEVGIFAIAKERLASYLSHYRQVDMRVDEVVPSPLAVYNAFAHERAEDTEPEGTIYLDIGTTSTDVIICDADNIWMRTLPIGGNSFTEALVRSFKLSYTKAERLKREAGTSKYKRQIFQAMRPVFAELVQELQRSLGYYQSLHRESHLTKLVGVGSTFRLPGLQKFLKQQLQLEVTRPEGFAALEVEARREAAMTDQAMNLYTAYGLALQGLGLEQVSSNLLPRQIQVQRMWKAKEPWIAAAAACVVAASAVAGGVLFTDYAAYRSNVQEHERQIELALNEAQRYQSQWRQEQADTDPQGKLEMMRGMLDYRNLWPRLVEDVTRAVAAVNPQDPLIGDDYEQASQIPRDQRRRLYIDSIEVTYRPVGQNDGRAPRFEAGSMTRASDFWPAPQPDQSIEEYFENLEDRRLDGWRPPRFEITLKGTTPYSNAAMLLSRNVVRWLEDNTIRPDRPYRLVVDNEEVLAPLDRVGEEGTRRSTRTQRSSTRPSSGVRRDQMEPMEPMSIEEPRSSTAQSRTSTRTTTQRRQDTGVVPWERVEDSDERDRDWQVLSFDNLFPRRPPELRVDPNDWQFELRWTVEIYPPEMARATQRGLPLPDVPSEPEAPQDEVAAADTPDDALPAESSAEARSRDAESDGVDVSDDAEAEVRRTTDGQESAS